MIPKLIIDAIEIMAMSFALVLLAVQVLPKEKPSNIVRLKHRAENAHRSYKKIRKAG